ncbi:unnamed protein product [Closterium sp. Yama58-4]|nr:unnamed protein product [Closterium sp. Yama58-4]
MSHGVPMTVRQEEVAGGTLRQQEEAMAALKKEVDEMGRVMAKFADANGAQAKVAKAEGAEPTGANAKVAAAKGALETGSNGEPANGKDGAGSAGKAGDGDLPETLDGKEIIAIVENFITEHVAGLRGELASQAEGLQQQLDAVRSEAADAAGVKAEIARVRAAAERQTAEVAYVRAMASHTEERTNNLEVAVAEGKNAQKKVRAEERSQPEGGAGAQAGAEMPEGKRRKLDEAGKAEGVTSAAAGGRALIANCGASDGRQEGEIKAFLLGLQKTVDGLLRRVAKAEDGNRDRVRLWELGKSQA